MLKKNTGITLVALVVTIVVLVILATITISIVVNSGIVTKTQDAAKEQEKQTAKESMNLKITNIQIVSYAENRKLPTLQYLADKLCEDEEIEYVLLESKKTASLNKIVVGNNTSIYTKLKQYPYEFEINSSLKLASIDGVKTTSTAGLTDEMKKYIDERIATKLTENEVVQYNNIISNSYGSLSISRVGNIVFFSGYYPSATYTTNVNVIPEKYMPDGARNWCGSGTGYGADNSGKFTTSGVFISADGKITTNNNMRWTIYNGTYEIVSNN